MFHKVRTDYLLLTIGFFAVLWAIIAPIIAKPKVSMNHHAGFFGDTPEQKLVLLAREAHKRKQDDKADRLYSRYLAEFETSFVQEEYAKFLLETGRGGSGKSLAMYRNIVNGWSTSRNDPEVLLQYARLCEEAGQQEEANSAYRKILSQHGSNPHLPALTDDGSDPKRLKALALVVVGVDRENHAHLNYDAAARTKAIALFDEALGLVPDLPAATMYREQSRQRIETERGEQERFHKQQNQQKRTAK